MKNKRAPMKNLSRLELFMNFGFRKDPVESELIETGDTFNTIGRRNSNNG
jgi:hypothetical protein